MGMGAPVSAIAADYAGLAWPSGLSTVLATGQRRTAIAAAFANAVASNGTDIDDFGMYTWGHPGAQVVPTALALGEELGVSGAQLIAAVVVGYEVAFRAGRCLNYGPHAAPPSANREYRACGSWGSAACAAIGAHLRRLTREQTANALGIAEYHSPDAPMMRDIASPAMVKHAIGVGALTGIMAAELASRGFTGVPSMLLTDEYSSWTADVGREYLLPSAIAWKRFSCCAYSHAALLAVEQIQITRRVPANRVRNIRVESYSDAVKLRVGLPGTTEEAQFSMSWPVAVMLLDGQVHPSSVLPERLADPSVRSLASKVGVVENPELTELFLLSESNDPRGKEAAIVQVELDDGEVLNSGVVAFAPFLDPPPSREAVENKFRWVTLGALPQHNAEKIIRMSRDLSVVQNIGELVELLTAVKSGSSYEE